MRWSRIQRSSEPTRAALSRGLGCRSAEPHTAPGRAWDRTVVKGYTAKMPLPSADNIHELLIRNAVDYAIFMLDPHGRVMSWNPGAQQTSQSARPAGRRAAVECLPLPRSLRRAIFHRAAALCSLPIAPDRSAVVPCRLRPLQHDIESEKTGSLNEWTLFRPNQRYPYKLWQLPQVGTRMASFHFRVGNGVSPLRCMLL